MDKPKLMHFALGGMGLLALAAIPASIASCAAPAAPSADGVSADDAAADGTNDKQMSDAQVQKQSDRKSVAQTQYDAIKNTPAPQPQQSGSDGGQATYDMTAVDKVGTDLFQAYGNAGVSITTPSQDDYSDPSAFAKKIYSLYQNSGIEYMFLSRDQFDSDYSASFKESAFGSAFASSDDAAYVMFLLYFEMIVPNVGIAIDMHAFDAKYSASITASGDQVLTALQSTASLLWTTYSPFIDYLFAQQKSGGLTGNIAGEMNLYADMYAGAQSL